MRKQVVVPAQHGATQPARDVAVDDEAPLSKMRGLSVVLLAYSANARTNTLGTKNGENKNLQESSSKFVAIPGHFCGFGLCLCTPARAPLPPRAFENAHPSTPQSAHASFLYTTFR